MKFGTIIIPEARYDFGHLWLKKQLESRCKYDLPLALKTGVTLYVEERTYPSGRTTRNLLIKGHGQVKKWWDTCDASCRTTREVLELINTGKITY